MSVAKILEISARSEQSLEGAIRQGGMTTVNWDQRKGKWHQIKGSTRAKWRDLTDDEIGQIDGNREIMVGKIQEKYGVAKEEAERQVEEWSKSRD